MKLTIVTCILAATVTGCSMPTAPDTGKCVLATKFDGEFYVNYTVWVPSDKLTAADSAILPDSACTGTRP